MKIAVLSSFSPSLVNFRGHLLRQLTAMGHEVVAFGPESLPSVTEKLSEWKVRFQHYDLARGGINPFKDFYSFWALFRLLRGERPELVLSYTAKPIIYGSFAARLAGVKYIQSLITGLGYSFIPNGKVQWIISLIARSLYRFSLRLNKKIFFQNEDDAALFRKLGLVAKTQSMMIVNGSGVSLEDFPNSPPPENRIPLRFLMISRLVKEKGVFEFIQAATELKSEFGDAAKFVLVGGIENHRVGSVTQDELSRWLNEGTVEYKGELSDVRKEIEACHVYVLPSYREGTPRTVLEAMSVGRAIVTTNVPGCRQTVQDGVNGFLVPERNATALAKAMHRFMLDPSLINKMAQESRKRVVERFDVEKVTQTMIRGMLEH